MNSKVNNTQANDTENLNRLFSDLCQQNLETDARGQEEAAARLVSALRLGWQADVEALESDAACRGGYLLEVAAHLSPDPGTAKALRERAGLLADACHAVSLENEETFYRRVPGCLPASEDELAKHWHLRVGCHLSRLMAALRRL